MPVTKLRLVAQLSSVCAYFLYDFVEAVVVVAAAAAAAASCLILQHR
jgi:hypothetical protein